MNIEEIINIVLSKENSAFFYTPSFYNDSFSYLFEEPVKVLSAKTKIEFEKDLAIMDKELSSGLIGYNLIAYEAGYLLEDKLNKLYRVEEEIFKAVLFNKVSKINSQNITIDFNLGSLDYSLKDFRLNISEDQFIRDVHKIKGYIEEGDTYQVNYTVKGKFQFNGDYSALFKSLIFNQSAKYTAIINCGSKIIISLSPELFFSIDKKKNIIAKPMKGTIKRGKNLQDDRRNFELLAGSEKDRAENSMIVDLLRNDIGKISEYGSVITENIFEIEKYESVFQMVSKVKGVLKKDCSLSDVLKSLFPCGSITGAPKIRTMEIINELEKEKRGIYTGGIGLILEDKTVFNVAIRTIEIDRDTGCGVIGLGSGIVWDSIPDKEYKETLLKGEFLLKPQNNFEIFETCKVEYLKVYLLEQHLNRLKHSADYFLFNYDEEKIRSKIQEAVSKLDNGLIYRIKYSLNKGGDLRIETSGFPAIPSKVRIIISGKEIDTADKFRYFKTTNRKLYNSEFEYYNSKGFFDVIFLNENGYITEGAISNIFLRKGGKWFTPHIDCGILPGVFRESFKLKLQDIEESKLTLSDLVTADEVILTNSLRGVVRVDGVYLEDGELIKMKSSAKRKRSFC
ncbi:MAG: aminodeoxychorismate synthase component I [Ignavibacteriaceae bacterium]